VINYEIPNIPETYVHRIGRTGRAGLEGKAVSFCDIEEYDYLRDIQKLISIEIPVVTDHPYPAENLPVPGAKKVKAKSPGARAGARGGNGSPRPTASTGNSSSTGESRIPKPTRPQSSRPPVSHAPKSDSAPKKYWGK